MLIVSYIGNSIEFESLDPTQEAIIEDLWVDVRESYSDWVSDVRLKPFVDNVRIIDAFNINGFSAWWVNRLTQKNSFETNQWLNRLFVVQLSKKIEGDLHLVTDDLLVCKTIHDNNVIINLTYRRGRFFAYLLAFKKSVLRLVRLFLSFARHIEILFVLGMFRKTNHHHLPVDDYIWFKTLFPINWTLLNGEYQYDRQFCDTPYKDKHFNQKSAFAVFLLKSKANGLNLFNYRRAVIKFVQDCPRPVFFPEATLTVFDIFSVYAITLYHSALFFIYKRRIKFRSLFKINGLDFHRILFDEWNLTYFGQQQNAILQGLAQSRFFKKINGSPKVISYGEFFSANRAGYFFTKKSTPSVFLISIQHAINAKNKLFTYYRKSEFSYDARSYGNEFMPYPDLYLAQGIYYKRVLEEFYPPNKIGVIGSLKKNDDCAFSSINSDFSLLNNERKSGVRHILIAPSTADEYKLLLDLFRDWDSPFGWSLILSPHPTVELATIAKYQNEVHPALDVFYPSSLSTSCLMKISDLVVCSFSTTAIDAFALGVQSVRYIRHGVLPQFDPDPRIPIFRSSGDFMDWFNKFSTSAKKIDNNIVRSFVSDYYYKNDDLASDRLWQSVIDI